MMIEDLNKTQLILLTLLISFVTSIGTGIITFSLLQEAPANVTQTINRVVEKTIEKVVPEEGGGNVIKEVTTVVVKEEDLVIDAIASNSKAVVRIRDNALVDGVSQFYGLGFLVSKDGYIVSERKDIINPSSTYTATFPDGTSFSMKVLRYDSDTNIAVFNIVKDPKIALAADPVKLAASSPQLGQTVITIEGQDKNIVTTGRVSSLTYVTDQNKQVSRINSDISSRTNVGGGPLINLNGEVAGVRSGSVDGLESFISAELIKLALSRIGS